jgi:hypothetical protein
MAPLVLLGLASSGASLRASRLLLVIWAYVSPSRLLAGHRTRREGAVDVRDACPQGAWLGQLAGKAEQSCVRQRAGMSPEFAARQRSPNVREADLEQLELPADDAATARG